jgi:hypothetical protein
VEIVVIAAILAINVRLWWRLRTDDAFLNDYVRTSPKALIWRRTLGEERAAEVIRTRFVPFGIALWTVALLALGGARLLGALLE